MPRVTIKTGFISPDGSEEALTEALMRKQQILLATAPFSRLIICLGWPSMAASRCVPPSTALVSMVICACPGSSGMGTAH